MSGDMSMLQQALPVGGAASHSVVAVLMALVNLLTHVPFTDLPSPLSMELGDLRDEYDYVIVGGGSAGSVVANRLSADPNVRVLLLEAGGLETAARQIPALPPIQIGGQDDWAYMSVPQRNACLSFHDQRSPLPSGKVLGGTGSINYMMYLRGNRHDYDRWATEYGASGWAYEDVLPHFKDIEDFRAGEVTEYHGTDGEVPVSNVDGSTAAISPLYMEACQQAGYAAVDYNGPTQSGCSRLQANIKNGVRVSSSKAFITPVVEERENLHVAVYSQATKVNFEGSRAVGVSFTRLGEPGYVKARREVILSAGAVGSARLLLISGVGPKEDLERLQIPLVADLPVGRSFQDHVDSFHLMPVLTDQDVIPPSFRLKDVEQFAYNRTGTMSVPATIEVVHFLNSDNAPEMSEPPNILVNIMSSPPADDLARVEILGMNVLPEAYDGYLEPLTDQPGFRVGIVLLRPKSRGRVTLRSTDPNEDPLIDPGLFTHPDDIKAIAQGTKIFLESILSTDAMRSIGARASEVPLPACANAGALWSLEYIECLYRNLGLMSWHTCCTAPMGSHSDAVVDERLRVRGGITGLRVADASVMPDITSATTYAPCLMIGSKAAEMILEDYRSTEDGTGTIAARGAD